MPLTAESLPELVLGHGDLFRESFSQDVARLESLNHFVLDSHVHVLHQQLAPFKTLPALVTFVKKISAVDGNNICIFGLFR